MKRRFLIVLTFAIALAFAIGGPTLAESPDEATDATAVATEEAPMVVRGMQLFIDADTGAARPPTKEEAASLGAQWREMFGTQKFVPRVFNYKNGMTAVELDASMLKFSAARLEADGSLTMDCIQGPQQTLEFIESATTTGPAEE